MDVAQGMRALMEWSDGEWFRINQMDTNQVREFANLFGVAKPTIQGSKGALGTKLTKLRGQNFGGLALEADMIAREINSLPNAYRILEVGENTV